jgi:hypothetical protein
MSYHDTLIDLIAYILRQDNNYLNNLDKGNAYDKLIRNYHQFNQSGEKVYRRSKLMQLHYRFSADAWQNRNDLSKLYFEHLYPLKKVKDELRNLTDSKINQKQIKKILSKTEIVVITKPEARELNKYFKDSVPTGAQNRLQALGIEIEEMTNANSLGI